MDTGVRKGTVFRIPSIRRNRAAGVRAITFGVYGKELFSVYPIRRPLGRRNPGAKNRFSGGFPYT